MNQMVVAGEKATLQSVPMLDFGREYAEVREEVLAAIEAVCAGQRFILGPEVARFEQAAADACGVAHAVGCASGTDALWLALAALEIGPGHAVVTTPFSFFATVSSILRAGATPLLADIDEATFNLDPAQVKAVSSTRKVTAVMPVHLYGQCADMDALRSLASTTGLRIVEDAAQAFGATWNGVRAGALGDVAAFSFYPTKNLSAYGDAGMTTTADDALAERMTMLRAHGMRKRYFHDEVGWNSRLDTLQAAVLEVKLRRVDAGNARRREIAAKYDDLFRAAGIVGSSTADGIVLPFTDPRAGHVFHQYVIRTPKRDALKDFLTNQKIGSEIYYPLPLHLQESLKSLGYKLGDFPVSEKAANEVLALPIFPELREDEQETVVAAIRRFYR
ncbi:DegT/DnrJ/EryC1/StrS family aminotransferase [Granulicella paludicola]|uniref:DegT/DnrJ/EryC1/StrS family aminotransferase n=1 Tax=Granulicella paludicola TaxID=474951 RepID=UPI0021DFA1E6|nr:DegT/DnrJ/EryC1/StrS family aminotransferase [Granulicella paludicola]